MSCVFCEIATGRLPAKIIHRSNRAMAFLPKDGFLAPGHSLVAPLGHFTDLFDVDDETLNATMDLVRRLGEAMRATIGASGVNVLNASGPHSEQSVFHLHFHVVPRWPGDGFTTWPTGRSNVNPIKEVEIQLGHLDGGLAVSPTRLGADIRPRLSLCAHRSEPSGWWVASCSALCLSDWPRESLPSGRGAPLVPSVVSVTTRHPWPCLRSRHSAPWVWAS